MQCNTHSMGSVWEIEGERGIERFLGAHLKTTGLPLFKGRQKPAQQFWAGCLILQPYQCFSWCLGRLFLLEGIHKLRRKVSGEGVSQIPMLPHKVMLVNKPTDGEGGVKNWQNLASVICGCPHKSPQKRSKQISGRLGYLPAKYLPRFKNCKVLRFWNRY